MSAIEREGSMTATLRTYRFELCWLVLLVVMFLMSPARPSTQDMNYQDRGYACPGTGWCWDDPLEWLL
jgi:hypothetical protein